MEIMMFNEKTVIITGASSGIGKEIANTFLNHGANIVINARTKEPLEKFYKEFNELKDKIAVVVGDISKSETSQQIVETAIQRFGSIDVLVNNAGIFVPKPFLEATEDELDTYLDITVKGSFFACQNTIPAMIKIGGGIIINIGSLWVEHPIEATPCAASQVAKGGMHTLTRHLAIEFATDNIRVNTIAPAVIDTPLYDDLMERKNFEQLADLHPLRRIGKMQDIVSWVLHLAGHGGNFVTGQTFMVDGGITAGAHTR
jgi:NAD(P)-dependent dehydrogenase (short-subunit alcohol dehydrogenase family)